VKSGRRAVDSLNKGAPPHPLVEDFVMVGALLDSTGALDLYLLVTNR